VDELIKDRLRHLDAEIAASEERVRVAWRAMLSKILVNGQTADRAHVAVSDAHNLTAEERGRLSAYYYEWAARAGSSS
jgi:hypothetical protein